MLPAGTRITIETDHILVERPENYVVTLPKQVDELAAIMAAAEDSGIRKVLILGPKTMVKLSFTEIHELGERIARAGLRIGLAESHDAAADDVDFLETVTFNRGGSMNFFATAAEAKQWLSVE